jgi:hypothetical protein
LPTAAGCRAAVESCDQKTLELIRHSPVPCQVLLTERRTLGTAQQRADVPVAHIAVHLGILAGWIPALLYLYADGNLIRQLIRRPMLARHRVAIRAGRTRAGSTSPDLADRRQLIGYRSTSPANRSGSRRARMAQRHDVEGRARVHRRVSNATIPSRCAAARYAASPRAANELSVLTYAPYRRTCGAGVRDAGRGRRTPFWYMLVAAHAVN